MAEFGERGEVTIELDNRLQHVPLSPNEEIHVLQIVREALSNVVRHSQAQRAWVRLSSQADGQVSIAVEDDGVGFDPQQNRSGHYGLTIMRERGQTLGSQLRFEARAPHGTRVLFSFVPTALQPSAAKADPMTDMPATADEPVRLLLVDDHPMMRKGVAQLLELEDDLSVVGEAGSGEEALRLAAELDPDMILLDLNMKGMNGLDTLRALRGPESTRASWCSPCPTTRATWSTSCAPAPTATCSGHGAGAPARAHPPGRHRTDDPQPAADPDPRPGLRATTARRASTS